MADLKNILELLKLPDLDFPFDYQCPANIHQSQQAADLYGAGVKLWTKADLRDIEQQLAQLETIEIFTVRTLVDGKFRIENAMFGKKKPIWLGPSFYVHAVLHCC